MMSNASQTTSAEHARAELELGLEILSRTPDTIRSLLAGLPDPLIRDDEGPDTWSPYHVVGHLLHGERTDWLARAERILEHGETRPFEPFGRFAMLDEGADRDIAELLDDFHDARDLNLERIRQILATEPDLEMRGTHPDFGPVTLGQLLAAWVVHDLNHLAQVARVLAGRYRDVVGPWAAYLPILAPREPDRTGHPADG